MKLLNVYTDTTYYDAGRSEDGTAYTAECYLVVAEYKSGEVYAHATRFPGCSVERDEEGEKHFVDVRTEASAKAEHLSARINACLAAGGALDPAHWHFYRNVYGSSAYVQEISEMTDRQRAGEDE